MPAAGPGCATVEHVSDLDEIRDRMDALEAEVSRLREDAAATRTLSAMADRDASEVRGALRAHTQSLNALRETQMEQGRTLDAHTRTLHTLADAVGGLVTGQQVLTETVSDLAATVSGLAQTVGGLAQTWVGSSPVSRHSPRLWVVWPRGSSGMTRRSRRSPPCCEV